MFNYDRYPIRVKFRSIMFFLLGSHISTQRKEGGYSIPKFGTEGRKLKMGMELEMVGREPLSRMEWEMEKRKN